MIDLRPAPVPELSDDWIVSHRTALVDSLSRRDRRPLKWAALVGTTGAAATVSTLVVVGGSQQAAFAGWSPAPTPPASGQLSTADANCRARLEQAAELPPTNKGPAPDVTSFVPELSDVRGPYTITVLGDGARSAVMCISAPGALSLRWIAGSGPPAGAGAIAVDQMSVLARDSQAYTLVEGRTGAGVTGVTLSLGNGTTVTATNGGGIFVAWWPGSETVTSATVTTAAGTSTQTLNLAGPDIPPPPKSQPSQPAAHSSCVTTPSVGC